MQKAANSCTSNLSEKSIPLSCSLGKKSLETGLIASWNKEVFLYLRLNISIMIILEKKCCWFGVIFSGSNMQCRQSHFPLSVILQKNSHCLIVSLLQCNCEWSESILLEWKEKRFCIKLVWCYLGGTLEQKAEAPFSGIGLLLATTFQSWQITEVVLPF